MVPQLQYAMVDSYVIRFRNCLAFLEDWTFYTLLTLGQVTIIKVVLQHLNAT